MTSLYPSILFHFTTKAGLFGILDQNFSISYAREKIVGTGNSTGFAAPMVSFCDLRLSELKDHMGKYGRYGIGLSKTWANKRGLNPVFYVNKHSPYTSNFISSVEAIFAHLESIHDIEQFKIAQKAYMGVMNTYRYVKNYEGDLKRKGKATIKDYRFADEREWRYVPKLDEAAFPFVPLKMIRTKAQKTKINSTVRDLKLLFGPEDIRYLVVERDDERLELITHLEMVKVRYPEPIRRRLASRILTADQIASDI